MKRFLLIILPLIFQSGAMGMIPLEGLVYGDVKDLHHYDPLEGVFSYSAMIAGKEGTHAPRLKSYIGLTNQGRNLKYACEFHNYYKYETPWQEHNARRAVAATLQYVGIDITMNAIVQYAKLFEYSDSDYENLVNNLVTNYCSPNITVFSQKKIKDNFLHKFKSPEAANYTLPTIKGMPYYSQSTQQAAQAVDTRQREFDITIKNFRAFCSWGNDAEDFRLMAPYLANPYIYSMVINHLLGRKMTWDGELGTIVFSEDDNTVKVACENYLCRRANDERFLELLPRMIGATNLYQDFESLYCGYFRDASYKLVDQNPKVREWIKKQTVDDPYLEVLQFIALYTGHSELLISAEKFTDISKLVGESIIDHWDKWADNKADQVVFDLLYEEAMHIDLKSKVGSYENSLGEFQMEFVYTLGELDRVLDLSDKLHAQIHLKFPQSFLRWVRQKQLEYNNKSRYHDLELLRNKVIAYINLQLQKKKENLFLPLWNDRMGSILADELMTQLDHYQGSKLNSFSKQNIDIPVKFYFGIFALQYIHNKFKEKIRSKSLTFTQKGSS